MPLPGGRRSLGVLCCRILRMAHRTSWMVKGRFSSCLLWAWLKT